MGRLHSQEYYVGFVCDLGVFVSSVQTHRLNRLDDLCSLIFDLALHWSNNSMSCLGELAMMFSGAIRPELDYFSLILSIFLYL